MLPPSLNSVWKPDELRVALMPTLEKLYRQEPDSLPFRQPVDPVQCMIPVCGVFLIDIVNRLFASMET